MLLVKEGDILRVTEKVADFLNEGDLVKVISTSEAGMITYSFGKDFSSMGIMDFATCEKHFEKAVSRNNSPVFPYERFEEIIENSDIHAETLYGCLMVVHCRLPNGYVIVESFGNNNPDTYDEEICFEVCMGQIQDRIVELETYRIKEQIYMNELMDSGKCLCGMCTCENCDEEFDGCDDEEMNCEDCDDTDCLYNPDHPHGNNDPNLKH